MSTPTFSGQLRQQTDRLWSTILEHPFVKGIGSGDLNRERYEFYLKQDYIYLIEFSRVSALAAAKSQRLADMSYFAKLLNATLNMEMDLHRKTCADFGIKSSELEKTKPAFITTSYTNLMLKTCYEGNLLDILAVLLPCEAGYSEIAQYLKAKGYPSNRYYCDWIDTYSSPEFTEFANWLKARLDEFTKNSSAEDKKSYHKLYLTSTRFELLFFEMSWNMEVWPAVVTF